jgi:hypothetical protein
MGKRLKKAKWRNVFISVKLFQKSPNGNPGPQTFFQGKAKFSRSVRNKNMLFAKKRQKDTIFLQESLKTYYFWTTKAG